MESDFQYLLPPSSALNIVHDDYYIKHGVGANSVRKILYRVKFDEFEEKSIAELETRMREENIVPPLWWNHSEALRWCYSGHFEIRKCIDNLKRHLTWLADEKLHKLTPTAQKILSDGVIYQYGRDAKMRPIIVLNIHMIDTKVMSLEDFLSALVYLLDMVKRVMFLPGYIENWIILLETNELGLFSMPVSMVKAVIEVTQNNYPSCLHKLYILNPSMILSASWSVIKKMMDPETAEKMAFLKRKELGQLQENIPRESLEQRFGGTLPNLTSFWPPSSLSTDRHVIANNFYMSRDFEPNNYRIIDLDDKDKGLLVIPQSPPAGQQNHVPTLDTGVYPQLSEQGQQQIPQTDPRFLASSNLRSSRPAIVPPLNLHQNEGARVNPNQIPDAEVQAIRQQSNFPMEPAQSPPPEGFPTFAQTSNTAAQGENHSLYPALKPIRYEESNGTQCKCGCELF